MAGNADEVGDPSTLTLTTRLNGEVMQYSTTDLLIFDVADIIVYLSEFTELRPGDIIATGTPGGVGVARDPAVFMQPGDTIESISAASAFSATRSRRSRNVKIVRVG